MGGDAELRDRVPAAVTLACKGLVCSPESRGGCAKGCGVVVGFFHWTHTHPSRGGGTGVLEDAAQAHPTSLGSQISSKKKKQRASAEPLPHCPGIATPGVPPCGQAAQPPEQGWESAPLWLECVASHLCHRDSCKMAL